MLKKIYILGGGVTGLASAYELLKHGHKVEIIEKSSMIGGLARTESWKGKPIDMGPHIYHTPDSDIKNYLLNIKVSNVIKTDLFSIYFWL